MHFKRTNLLALALAFILTAPALAMTIAENGAARCAIVLAPDAIEAERTAATELRDHLRQVTGADLPIKTAADASEPAIFVGAGEEVKKRLPDVKWDTLGHDGIVIRSVDDNHIVLAGGRPRGSLYAVYTFLEDTVGVRWWTDTESTIPHKPTLGADDLDIVYVPTLRYRESFHNHVLRDHYKTAARFKLNGHFSAIPAKWGNHYDILGWCHTSYSLLPPDRYFGEHPEWYSMHNGKRDPNAGQLCWSNPQMQQELARRALKWIRKNPDAGIISISQNDCIGNCQCDRCRAIDEENGAPSGSLITGVNAVARIIAKQYPDFLIETLAYQYSRKPPSKVKPDPNVLVRLCSIECDFSHPLAGPSNQSFGDDLRGWSKLAKNLFIWNYTTNFASYTIPQPNLMPTADDLRFFVDHHVVGVFEQADSANHLAGDMLPLRCWLQAHLMWDPSRDQDKLIDEFLAGYYGPAGTFLKQYLQVVNAPAKDPKFRRGCYHTDVGFLSPADVKKCNELFDSAERAVARDAALLKRVKRERLPLEHVNLLKFNFPAAIAARAKSSGEGETAAAKAVCADYEARAKAFVTAATEAGVRNYSEGIGFPAYASGLALRYERFVPPDLPKPGEPLPDNAIDIQQDRFHLYNIGKWADIVPDQLASDGNAARMPGGHTEWAVQFPIPADSKKFGKGPWRCYIIARVKLKQKAGQAFRYGAFNNATGAQMANEAADMDVAGDEQYHAYGMRFESLTPGMYFWVSPPGSSAVESVYIDRIYLIRDAK